MDTDRIAGILRLQGIPGIGHLRTRTLIEHFGSPEAVLAARPQELLRVDGMSRRSAVAIARHGGASAFADEQLRLLDRSGAIAITLWDDRYPPLLKRIYDPPVLLFVRGASFPPDRPTIAVVGTRRPSAYGIKMTRSIVRDLADAGVGVVSGLARGIDTIAHAEALAAGGVTLGVLGSGIDVPYPRENAGLMTRMEERGAVISECAMGAQPDPQNFPRRNRIVSGLSAGTVVVESDVDGGAMITASTALDQNREVFALPGSVLEPKSAGPHALIRDGRAKLVQSVADILAELPGARTAGPDRSRPSLPPMSLFEQKLYELITLEPVHIDVLVQRTGIGAADALVALLGLECKNVVRQLPGKYFTLL